jgi:hypothetical protein
MRVPVSESSDVALGDTVKDLVTGFKGMAVAYSMWLHGCERIVIEPQKLKDGATVEPEPFDIQRIEVVRRGKGPPVARAIQKEPPGGPQRGESRMMRR